MTSLSFCASSQLLRSAKCVRKGSAQVVDGSACTLHGRGLYLLRAGLACRVWEGAPGSYLPQREEGDWRSSACALHPETGQSVIAAPDGHAAGSAQACPPSGPCLPHCAPLAMVLCALDVPSCSAASTA